MAMTVRQRLRTDIETDTRDASRDLTRLARKADEAGDATEAIGDRTAKGMGRAEKSTGSFFGKLGGLMAGAAKAAAAAGAVVGVAFAGAATKGIQAAFERGKELDRISASLGGGVMGARAGEIAGRLYAQAYGDSVRDTGEVVMPLMRRFGENANAALIEGLAGKGLSVADVLGEDPERVMRVAIQMDQIGITGSVSEALDVLAKGATLGTNRAGDMLDTFEEFGPAFRELNLSGSQALGLMNQFLEAGGRNTDQFGNSLNELTLRIKQNDPAALEALGELFHPKEREANTRWLADQIKAGGPGALSAMQKVMSRLNVLQRDDLSAAIFGTSFEDSSAEIFASLNLVEAGMLDVADAAGKLDRDLTDNPATRWAEFQRDAMERLVNFAGTHLVPVFEGVLDFFDTKLGPAMSKDGLGGVWDLVVDEWNHAWPKIRSWLGETATKLGEWIEDQLPAALEKGADLWADTRNWIMDSLPGWLEALGGLIDDAVDWLDRDGIPRLSKWLEDEGVPALVDWITNSWAPFSVEMNKLFAKAVLWLTTEGVAKTFGAMVQVGRGLRDGFLSAIGVYWLRDKVDEMVTAAWNKIVGWGATLWNPLWNGFADVINAIIRKWNEFVAWVPFDIGDRITIPELPDLTITPPTPDAPRVPPNVKHAGTPFFEPMGGRNSGFALLARGERVVSAAENRHGLHGGGGGRTVELHFHGPVTADGAEWVAEQVRKARRRGDL